MFGAAVFAALAAAMLGLSLYSWRTRRSDGLRWRWKALPFAAAYAAYALSHYYRSFLPRHHETPLVETWEWAGTAAMTVAVALLWWGRRQGSLRPGDRGRTGAA